MHFRPVFVRRCAPRPNAMRRITWTTSQALGRPRPSTSSAPTADSQSASCDIAADTNVQPISSGADHEVTTGWMESALVPSSRFGQGPDDTPGPAHVWRWLVRRLGVAVLAISAGDRPDIADGQECKVAPSWFGRLSGGRSKREPGGNPGLPRSGKWNDRRHRTGSIGLGSDGQ
jgi:hypothetical protein